MAECYGTMPSSLPKTLPAWTKFKGGWAAATELKLDGEVYRGAFVHTDGTKATACVARWVDWSSLPIQSPLQEELGECAACGGKACRSSGGVEYAYGPDYKRDVHLCVVCWKLSISETGKLILARRAAKAIKEGVRVSGETDSNDARGPRKTGTLNGLGGTLSVLTDDDGRHWRVWTDSLRREEEPKKSGTVTNAATGVIRIVNLAPSAPERASEDAATAHVHVFGFDERCGECGATTMDLYGKRFDVAPRPHVSVCVVGDAPKKPEKFLLEDLGLPPIDSSAPYPNEPRLSANVGFSDWSAKQSGIATGLSKREQAKRQLDSGLTGPLRNRDRYGQLLSLRGWPEADESDP